MPDVSKGPNLLCSTGPFYMLPIGQVFEVFARAGFNASEVMVTSERESQDPATLAAIAGDFGVQVASIHAPFLLLTRNVFSSDPLEKIKRSVDLAHGVGSRTVVVHPAYRWQISYARWLENE